MICLCNGKYPLVMTNIANWKMTHRNRYVPIKVIIFHGYVKEPKGKYHRPNILVADWHRHLFGGCYRWWPKIGVRTYKSTHLLQSAPRLLLLLFDLFIIVMDRLFLMRGATWATWCTTRDRDIRGAVWVSALSCHISDQRNCCGNPVKSPGFSGSYLTRIVDDCSWSSAQ